MDKFVLTLVIIGAVWGATENHTGSGIPAGFSASCFFADFDKNVQKKHKYMI